MIAGTSADCAGETCERVVEDGRDENADDDRERLLEARRHDHRQQLGLVADLRERDDAGRNEQRFQRDQQGLVVMISLAGLKPLI